MIKSFSLAAVLMVAGAVYGAGEKTLADVGKTGIENDPNVELLDREDGTYALVFKSAFMTKKWGEADYSTTFTFNSPWAVKEFLVVGGGGAGGGNGGAGGGGGGVIYFTDKLLAANALTDNATTNFENGSTISLTIGAGGVGGFKLKGTPGGHSKLKLGDKEYVAYGGAGGADYGDDKLTIDPSIPDDKNPVPNTDKNTGCGAGRYPGMTATTGNSSTMPNLPGYYGTSGGEGVSNGYDYLGGGGGAGGDGGAGTSTKTKVGIGGKGGDGLYCPIRNVGGDGDYYAAGGGGSTSNPGTTALADEAEGGRGGGGHASAKGERVNGVGIAPSDSKVHASGYGCGGGGGGGGSQACAFGGSGSAGIVVLLIEPVEIVAEKPVVSVLVPEQGANYAKFSVSVVADGLENTTTSEVWGGWGKNADDIVCTKLADAVAVNGSVAKTVTGLEVGATYTYKFYAVNGNSVEGDAVTGTITLAAGDIDPTSAAPVIVNQGCTVLGPGVNIPYCVAWPGKNEESCSVTLKYGLTADKFSYSVNLGFGLIGNNSTKVENLIPGRKYYFQLTADNGASQTSTAVFTATIADGETFPTEFDENQPVIAGIGGTDGFVFGGNGILYSGTFANYVEGTVVTLHYKKNNEWLTDEATVTADGFSGAIENGLSYSTDYPYYFTATVGDFVDCTQEKVFNTKGASTIGNWLYNQNENEAKLLKERLAEMNLDISGTRIAGLEGSVTDAGCGTNTYLCLVAQKNGSSEWVVVSSNKMTQSGTAYILCSDEDAKFFEFGSSYGIDLMIRNVSFDGKVWEKRTEHAKGFNPSDDSTYTWCGTDGLWNDPSNWTTNKNKIGVAGYPVCGSTAKFADNAVATVRVERAERAKSFQAGSAKVTLSFNVPQDGIGAAMVQIDNAAFPGGNTPVTVEVDPKSGCFARTEDGKQLLVSSAVGITTAKVAFGDVDEERCAFRYAPAGSANPTELWLDVTVVDEPGTVRWTGAESDDWACSNNWKGGVAPAAGTVVRVAGTRTITLDGVTARITDASISIGEDGSLTVISGTVMPLPTLDVSRPIADKPLTVETATFGGIAYDDFTFAWSRGATVATRDYEALSAEPSVTPTADDYEHFFKCTVTDTKGEAVLEKEFLFSKLPVLYMTTDDGQTPTPKKEEHAGSVFVQGNADWKSPYDGPMTIKVRGNSTSNFAKKPWKIKLDEKTKMFGIAKSKHWVLLANYKDKSSMRNKLAYDLANEIGSLGMESTWVECFLNGEYQGLYQFGEHIRIDKERVNIFDWEGAGEDAADAIAEANGFAKADKKALEAQMSTDFAWVTSGKVTYTNVEYEVTDDFKNLDISGGYLVESSKEYDEVTKFTIKSGTLTFEAMLNSPEFLKTNAEMLDACKTKITDYWAACASADGYNAKGQHWSDLADTDSMATYFLTQELFGNDDAEKKSRYLYWDVGGRILFGPVWDFDWGVGNTLVDAGINQPETWRVNNDNERSFFREWTDDPWFCTRLRTLYWSKARDVLARMIAEGGELDRYHAYLAEAAAANDALWPLAKNNDQDKARDRSFEDDVANLRTFLTTRLAWLDKQFADVPTLMASLKAACSTRESNSPYTADDGLRIAFENAQDGVIPERSALQMSLTVTNGSVVAVDTYVNGLKVGESAAVVSGSVACEIPAAALTEASTNDNCVALVARNSSGAVVGRNYRLVQTVSASVTDGYTFYFNGDYTGDQVIAPTGAVCVLVFEGANIDGRLVLPDGVKAYLCPTNGSENAVKGIVGPNSSLTLKDFDGLNGSVSITGADTLVTISNLVVKSGTLDITSAGVSQTKTPIVNVLGHVKQDGGVVNLSTEDVDDTLQAYGIYVANKDPKGADGKKLKIVYAEFAGGEFNATVGGWKSAALYINKGSAEATFGTGSTNNVALVGPEARFVNASGDLNLKGGEFLVRMPDDCTSLTNARVFKSDKAIKIKGGHYDVSVPGPGSEIFSVNYNKEDESAITIDGGTFELVSDDDCFNSDFHIVVNDGLFYAVSLNNDVFDSNGDMEVNGGTIMAYATAAGHEAFDVEPVLTADYGVEHKLCINGGTIFATGGKNAAWPVNTVAGEGVNLYGATGIAADAIARKYASIKGVQTVGDAGVSCVVTSTAKLPAFPGSNGALLLTCPGMSAETQPAFGAEAPTEGDQQFHGLYITFEAAAETVSPGEPLGPFETEEEATAALAQAAFAPSADVTTKLGAESEALAAYAEKFSVGVFAGADGKWLVEAYLLPEQRADLVLSAQRATQQIPLAELVRQDAGTPLENVLLTNCVPGFYYSLYDAASVADLKADLDEKNVNILCGPDRRVVIPVLARPSSAAGFFSIGALEAPSVITGKTGNRPSP